jgi:asparagine synthase (glutamine-hydrolysing)
MSGVAALVAPPGASAGATEIQQLLRSLAFRGPDALEYQLCGGAALAHALLLTGESERPERQPLSLDGNTWVAADARLDARDELAVALRAVTGKLPDSLSDAALILHAYAAWGEHCAEHLLGDFSFALWDGWRSLLLCVRDQLGVKSLFYAPRRGGLAVSNTVQSLVEWIGDAHGLNEAAVGDFLLFGHNQNPATTFFREIQCVPPGHALLWRAGEFRLWRYWSCPCEGPLRFRRAEDCIEEFRGRLQHAVTDRVRDGRVSLLFSGGMDSTSIAATAKESPAVREHPGNLKAFTAAYRKLFDDREGEFASVAAEALQIPIEFVAGDEHALFAPSSNPGPFRPEPSDEPLAAFGESLYRAAATHSRVGLAGEGGDVILYPQSGPYLAWLLKGGHVFQAATEIVDCVRTHRRLPPMLVGLRSWGRNSLASDRAEPFPGWIIPEFAARCGLRERWRDFSRSPRGDHSFRPAAHRLLEAAFWPALFQSVDPGATGILFELRMPFFDLRVLTWVLSLPPLPWCTDKWLLRQAMRGRLPNAIRLRAKAPVSVNPSALLARQPASRWVDGLALAEETRQYVAPERLFPISGETDDPRLMMKLRTLGLNYWLQSLAHVKYKGSVGGF